MSNILNGCINKNVLFVTTKQVTYIRNNQEINLIKENAKNVFVAGSNSSHYIQRIFMAYILSIYYCLFKKIDVVFVGFAPQLMYPLFWLYKLKSRSLYIDFFISLYDTFVWDRKKFSPKSILSKCFYWLDYATIHSANYYIADTKAHKQYFVNQFNVDNRKGNVLYLEANTDIYYIRNVRRPNKFKNKYVVLYFGSILPLQGVEIILECIDQLKACPDVHFIMIGPIDTKYNKPMTNNVTYIEWLDEEKLSNYIEIADLCLAGHFSATIGKAKRTIPGKVYIYEAMGKKIVLGDSSANHELFTEDEKHIFVKQGSASALAEIILSEKNTSV